MGRWPTSHRARCLVAMAVLALLPAQAACGGGGATSQADGAASAPTRPVLAPSDRIIYLVLTDRFANGDPANDGADVDPAGLLTWHGGDFAGLTQRLDYLEGLGVTTVWITPIVEQIDHPVDWEGTEHWGYHGYWAEHFDRLEGHLGGPSDLRALLDRAHRDGLEVILDVVLNHSGYGSHFEGDPAWTRTCPEEFTDLDQCLFGLPDFRTEDPTVAAQLIDWQAAWFRDYPFDGLRADTVKHVEPEVWRQFLARVRSIRGDPHFFALGESWGTAPRDDEPLLAPGLFDAMYDFEFHNLVEGFLNGRMRAEALDHHLGRRNDLATGRYVHFLDTHDTELMTSRLDDPESYPLALVLLATSAGIPLLYYGDELGRPGGEWPHNRPDMDWELADTGPGTLSLTRQLLALRRAHSALTRGVYESVEASEGLVVFARRDGDDRVVVGLNRGPDPATTACSTPCEPQICVGCQVDGEVLTLAADGAAAWVE